MAFSCQTSRFTRITLETVRITNFSGVLTLYLTQGIGTHLNIGAKGSIPMGITQFGAPKLNLRPKQPGLLYVQSWNHNLACTWPHFE